MIRRVVPGLACLLLCLALVHLPGTAAQPKKDGAAKPPPPPPVPVIKLALPGVVKDERALKYTLLPDPLDRVSGNAAPLWIRAGLAAQGVRHKWTEKQYDWGGPARTALAKLPRKE